MKSLFSNRSRFSVRRAGMFVAALLVYVVGANASPIVNIAGTGTGTIGYTSDTTMNGTENDHAGSNTAINDNNLGTRVDDYPQTTNDYVGVTFGSPVSGYYVHSVGLVMATFVDGGWYGPSNTTPGQDGSGQGNPLTAADLTAPTLQITTDGTHWTNVATTNNYVSAMTGAPIGSTSGPGVNPTTSPLTTFTLDSPVIGIEGIRLIGNGGGVAGNGGFIGVFEFSVNAQATPEPSTLVLGGLGLIGLVVAARRRRR